MRALLCRELGPVENLVIEDLPDPQPGPGQVVVDVVAAALNFPDTLIIQGKYQARPELPFSPGAEAAGMVSAVGSGVDQYQVGDRVIVLGVLSGFGSFREKQVVPCTDLLPMPVSMGFETAAGFCLTYGTSYYALKDRAGLRPGETLLVLGAAGGVGLAAVELGHVMGAQVIAAASTAEKLAVAKAAGASMLVNYSAEPLKQRIKDLTAGRGADVIYDPVGGDLTEQAFRASAWNGRLLVIGFAAGEIPKIPLNLALLKSSALIGVFWGAWAGREPAASAQNFKELFAMHGEGKLRPLVTQVFDLDDYVAAYKTLTERRAQGKVILRLRD